MAWCAGVLTDNLATCPNMALRPLVIRSDTGAKKLLREYHQYAKISSKCILKGVLQRLRNARFTMSPPHILPHPHTDTYIVTLQADWQ